ncbi:nucleoid-associated protein [Aequorivita echinoideorum]|uniref:Nucleoid-associated protein n=1 Tax=Aequorivita echinoideorum TaxID=1549647 RepID=A0ABS5S339_9FLAO|nr:nucleoid-associated protein [Aequorivita echinoideorum]MBT0607622.1 nucleoid-associated protein [Aequorivita echinoideorum]
MINLFATTIETLFIHKVGNRSRNEELFISKEPYKVNDELRPILKEFFFKPFREKADQLFKFSEDSKLREALSEPEIIRDDLSFIDDKAISKEITQLLYDCGNHPHIKSGEVYIAFLKNIQMEDRSYDGIGIFKSEMKYDFIEFEKKENHLDVILKQGVNLNKLDKGAIIINDIDAGQRKVLHFDSNKYDTKYWIDNFLGLEELEDSSFYTKKYLKFCQDFGKDVVLPATDKMEEVAFINKAVNHFAKSDFFSEDEFLAEMDLGEDLNNEFSHYKTERAGKYQLDGITDFDISNESVSEARKRIKSEISLDTGITIKVAKGTVNSAKYLEKGWDEEKQMYYYLAYFNKEDKN